jgi:predicted alpha-1,2-mannosidase
VLCKQKPFPVRMAWTKRKVAVWWGCVTWLLLSSFLPGAAQSPARCVNPFIGASTSEARAGVYHGLGKTFPGAATPFGMVQVSPNTVTGGDNGSGYSDEHEFIEGFAFTQMSGVGWYGDLGNLLVTPTNGPLQVTAGRHPALGRGYRSRYDKKTEVAQAGYYAATLTDYGIRAEATAAPHSGLLKFTFPRHAQSRIQFDLARRVGGTSTWQYVKVVDAHTIEGWMQCTAEGGGWGNGKGHPAYTVYFSAQFSKPLRRYGAWRADIPTRQSRKREAVESAAYDSLVANARLLPQCQEVQGPHVGFYTEFATTDQEVVLLKSGISFVSLQGARDNRQRELPAWNFDSIRRQATDRWNEALAKITVTGGSPEQRTVFYTALYHSLLDPRTVTDLNGEYPGGDGRPHRAQGFTKRSVFSGWDVYRSQFPLQTLINPTVVSDMINSLVSLAEESGQGYLERWELLNAYSGCMIGNPAVSVIADAYNKGIRSFDVPKAYRLAVATCERTGNADTLHALDISGTLEQAYSEWCLAQLADSLGHPQDRQTYARRALTYRTIFDPQKGWFRPRSADGTWQAWPAKERLDDDYGTVESNPYQQGWFVPHDVPGMVRLMGGRDKVLADLTAFFEQTPPNFMWNDYYNHANEPVHHVPFLFNRLGAPWLTQKWARTICENAYHNSVEGLVGNDDVGQLSAWYVLAASGLHPVCPGEPRYEICSPLFKKVVIRTSGHPFTINAKNNSPANKYIQSAKLNGAPHAKCWLTHQQLLRGGTLELVMGSAPNEKWGLQ